MLGSIPDIPNPTHLGGSENLYWKQRNKFEKSEFHSSGRCGDFFAGKVSHTWGSSFETESLHREHNIYSQVELSRTLKKHKVGKEAPRSNH